MIPYWTRADIESGKAPASGMRELVYVDDPVEAFFLQIQGSGRVRLAEGGVMRVGYADQNGHPFRSIGRILIERGELTLDTASMQGDQGRGGGATRKSCRALLDENPSYVFFREVPPPAPGTLGSRDRRAASARSACRCCASARSPSTRARFLSARPCSSRRRIRCRRARSQRLMMAQDTGGAIRGAVRARFLLGLRRRGRTAGGTDEAGRADVDPVAR